MKMKMVTLIVFLHFAASMALGGVLDKAWIRGTTNKNPIMYKVGEKMTLTLSVEGLDGKLPEGEYFLQWARSGDDGIRETGKVSLPIGEKTLSVSRMQDAKGEQSFSADLPPGWKLVQQP